MPTTTTSDDPKCCNQFLSWNEAQQTDSSQLWNIVRIFQPVVCSFLLPMKLAGYGFFAVGCWPSNISNSTEQHRRSCSKSQVVTWCDSFYACLHFLFSLFSSTFCWSCLIMKQCILHCDAVVCQMVISWWGYKNSYPTLEKCKANFINYSWITVFLKTQK